MKFRWNFTKVLRINDDSLSFKKWYLHQLRNTLLAGNYYIDSSRKHFWKLFVASTSTGLHFLQSSGPLVGEIREAFQAEEQFARGGCCSALLLFAASLQPLFCLWPLPRMCFVSATRGSRQLKVMEVVCFMSLRLCLRHALCSQHRSVLLRGKQSDQEHTAFYFIEPSFSEYSICYNLRTPRRCG